MYVLQYTDQEIIKATLESNPRVIALDAAVYLPPGRGSLDEKNESYLRKSDRVLSKMGIKFPLQLRVQFGN